MNITDLQTVFNATNAELDKIIDDLKRKNSLSPITKCYYLNGEIIEKDIEYISDGDIFIYELTKIIIGTKVKGIGTEAFSRSSLLEYVVIPNSVEHIGKWAFELCPMLTSVAFLEKTISQVQEIQNYPWSLNSGCILHCADGDITI